jgi:magnesium-transporting ATPase (P-type)
MTTASAPPAEAAGAPGAAAAAPASRWQSARFRRRVTATVIFAIMVVIAVVMFYPFWYMGDNSFRSQTQFDRQSGHSLTGWTQLFQDLPVVHQLVSSTIVCAAAIVIILIVSTTAGFAFAKLRYRGSGLVFLLIVAAMMVPLQSIIIPELHRCGPGLRRARRAVRHVLDGDVLPGHLRRTDRGGRDGRPEL